MSSNIEFLIYDRESYNEIERIYRNYYDALMYFINIILMKNVTKVIISLGRKKNKKTIIKFKCYYEINKYFIVRFINMDNLVYTRVEFNGKRKNINDYDNDYLTGILFDDKYEIISIIIYLSDFKRAIFNYRNEFYIETLSNGELEKIKYHVYKDNIIRKIYESELNNGRFLREFLTDLNVELFEIYKNIDGKFILSYESYNNNGKEYKISYFKNEIKKKIIYNKSYIRIKYYDENNNLQSSLCITKDFKNRKEYVQIFNDRNELTKFIEKELPRI